MLNIKKKKTNAILNLKINNIIKVNQTYWEKLLCLNSISHFLGIKKYIEMINSDLGNSNFMLWFAYSTPNTSQWYTKHKWTNIQQGPKTR